MAIVDRFGVEQGFLFFRRPHSDEILDFIYEESELLSDEGRLRKIRDAAATEKKKVMHKMNVREFWIPWAKKIFMRCEGQFKDERGQLLEKLPTDEQFRFLSEFKAYMLVDMTGVAFNQEGLVKKKY